MLIEFSPKSLRSLFVLHLIVGVLKILAMKREADACTDARASSNDFEQNSTPASPAPKTHSSSAAGIRSAETSVVEILLDKSLNRDRLVSAFKLRSKRHCRSLAASKWTDSKADSVSGSKSEVARRPAKSTQEILSTTQFTSAELNRIILSVGGGYLLKEKPSPQTQRPGRSQFDIHSNKISYLGFDRLISSTKQQRENLKVSSLIS